MVWTGKFRELGIPLAEGTHALSFGAAAGMLHVSKDLVDQIGQRGGPDCILTVNGATTEGEYEFRIVPMI